MMDLFMTTRTHPLTQANRHSKRTSFASHALELLTARGLSLVLGLMILAACSDAPTAPQQSIDRVAAARVMPSVTDARVRLAPSIQNVVIRDRVLHDLQELENALTNGDGQKARFHVRVLGDVLAEYRTQQGSQTTDGADVVAISLMLFEVSAVVEADFDLGSFQ